MQFQQKIQGAHNIVLVADRRSPEQQQAASFVAKIDAIEQAAVFLLQCEYRLHEVRQLRRGRFALQADKYVDDLAKFAGVGLVDDAAGKKRARMSGSGSEQMPEVRSRRVEGGRRSERPELLQHVRNHLPEGLS